MRLAYSRKEWKAAICRYRDQVLPIVKLVNRRFIIASSYRRMQQLNSEPQEKLVVVEEDFFLSLSLICYGFVR